MSDIFISYASADREKAKLLAGALEQKGWTVWWDRKIPPGKTFSQVIKEALDNAKCIVVLWSNESVNSDWVQNEAAEGARRKILVPAFIEDVEIPFEFRRIQAAQLFDWDGISEQAEFELLVKSISSLLGAAVVQGKERQEDLFWQKIMDTNTIELYNDYLSQYPKGKHKNYALQKMQELEKIEKEKHEKQKILKSFKTEAKPTQKKQQKWRRKKTVLLLTPIIIILVFTGIYIVKNISSSKDKFTGNKLEIVRAEEVSFHLRKTPLNNLSDESVKKMLTDKYFFHKDWNKNGTGINHQYKKQKNGQIIFDAKTGLVWQQSGSENSMVYAVTLDYIDKLNEEAFAGYSDWRLPTLEEAMSLMENKTYNYWWFIDPVFDTKQDWIWTADKYSDSSAWMVNFLSGGCYHDAMSSTYSVRTVRLGQ